MNSGNEGGAFILGVLVGWFSVFGVITLTPNTFSQARAAIKECEKSLPRDQRCKVTATATLEMAKEKQNATD